MIGFSFGGEVAHLAALSDIRNALAPRQRFAAHVGFYPAWISGAYGRAGAYTGAPVLLLFGDKDDVNPQPKVRSYLAYLAKTHTGAPIETKVYRGAYHAWTSPRHGKPRLLAQAGCARKCPLSLIGGGGPRMLIDGEAREFNRALWKKCIAASRGYKVGYNAKIRAQSFSDMLAFFNQHIGH